MQTDAINLAVTTYHHIKRQAALGNRGEWNQETWRCGSGQCLAGWLVTIAGQADWITRAEPVLGRFLLATSEDDPREVSNMDGVRAVSVAARAARLLGHRLDDEPLGPLGLFGSHNSLEDIRKALTTLLGVDPEDMEPDELLLSTNAKMDWTVGTDPAAEAAVRHHYRAAFAADPSCQCEHCRGERA